MIASKRSISSGVNSPALAGNIIKKNNYMRAYLKIKILIKNFREQGSSENKKGSV